MPISPTSFDNITVGYITETEGYIHDVSLADANTYAETNPDTMFIFLDGDSKIRYLDIDGVNSLTPKDLLRKDPCITGEQPCGPPIVKFFGGHGVGAQGNPVVDEDGNLIAVDLVSGGFGYKEPPQVEVIDPCKNGTGAFFDTVIKDGEVIKVIPIDSGTGYLPPPQTVPQYPAVLRITDIVVTDPGINYNCGVDKLTITPTNGTVLSYTCDPFGKIKSVSVDKGGRFTRLPKIMMDTESGFNAKFVPVFEVIRDPQPIEPVILDVVQVFDLVGLNINGYVDGKEYYGNTYFIDGVKYAGTDSNNGTDIQVFDNRADSIKGSVKGDEILQ